MLITSVFQSWAKSVAALACVALLAACGGGGGKSSTANSVASLSSASSLSISSISSSVPGLSSASSLSSTISLSSSSKVSSVSSLSSLSSASNLSRSSSSVAPDTTPDAFSFTPVTDALLNTSITSNAVTITGINTATPISITGGQYTINGGTPTSAAGTITQGQTVTVTLTTAATVSTSTQAVLTVGGVSATFTVTTTNVIGGAVQNGPLNIAGVVTTLAGTPPGADGTGLAAKLFYPQGAISDGTNLYVADTGNHKIRKIVIATRVVTTLAGSGSAGDADGTGAMASFNNPMGIASDGINLYVADSENHKIRKIVIATGVVTTLAGSGSSYGANGTGTAASFNMPTGITCDGTNLYVADTYNHKIRKIVIATGVVSTLAGSFSLGSTDGIGTAASFNSPKGITNDGANLYVVDSGNGKIRKIVLATGVVTTLAGSGLQGSDDGTGAAASFNMPTGITSDGTSLYVADTTNNKIRKIVIATGVVTTLAGSYLKGSADGTGVAASFNMPTGITSDGTNLYVADTYNHNIRKIATVTGVVTTLAGSYLGGSTDGTAVEAGFFYPGGITSDGTNLFVADTWNNKIRKMVIATQVVTTLAGSGSQGDADGTGVESSFYYPGGVTSDGTNLYVADTYNHKIRKIEVATGAVTTLAGNGSSLWADGIGAAARFAYPRGITSDGTNLFVADSGNHEIRKIVIASGEVTTLAGNGSSDGTDGRGSEASFNAPNGITSDGTNLYVADTDNNKIRKIVIATGEVTTLAGSGLFGGADGTGVAASFTYPKGITTDGTNLYVADSNTKIRKIVIATGVVTTIAGGGSQGSTDGVGTAAQFNGPSGITSDGFSLFVTDTYNNTIRKIQ